MSKNHFNAFNEIKANDHLIANTKRKILSELQKTKPSFSVKKPVAAAISVVAVVAVLAVALSSGIGGMFVFTARAQDLMKGVTPQSVNVSGAVSNNFIKSTENFSVNLFKQSYKNGENALVSPTSACLALGMTANGASGSTLTAFQNVLGKYGMTVDYLNKAYKAYADMLTKKRGNTKLTLSNSIWLDNGFNANQAFLQNNANFFGATAEKLDFAKKSSVNVINDWVKSKTGGKIDKIVDKLGNNDVMCLINALYFEAKWKNPFDTEAPPISETFKLDNGSTSRVTYMNLEDNLDYVKTENETAVVLPYNDGHLAMLCILPKNGVKLSDYISSMSEKTITGIVSKKAKTLTGVALPQFKVTADNSLDSTLQNMGLGIAFNRSTADFSKMGENKTGLFISSVRQKTYLQVDELGTTASAATAEPMSGSSGQKIECIYFNRPFIYAIIDTKTNLPLFLGAMEKPVSTLRVPNTSQKTVTKIGN